MGNCQAFGTSKQKSAFANLIKDFSNQKFSLVTLLEEIQKIYGYLPKSIIEEVSKTTNTPESEIYGVASFYSIFSLSPKGKYVISVCLGTACYVNGSEKIFDKFCELLHITAGQTTKDNLFTIDQTRCLGCCSLAPVVTINNKVFAQVKLNDVEKIIKEISEKK